MTDPAGDEIAVEPLVEHDDGMPTWVWWLFGIAGLVIVLLVIFAVTTSTPEEQQPVPQPSASQSSSPSPSPSPSVTPEPSESPTPMPSPTDVPSDEPTPMPSPTDVPSDEPTPMPSPTDLPEPPSTFGEGKINVGQDALAGTYRVTLPTASGCVWALSSPNNPTRSGLASDVIVGGMPTVTLADGDVFVSKKCGTWSAVDPASLFKNVSAAVSAAPGVWLVGEDIRFGTWSTENLGETSDPSQACKWTVTESLGTNFTTTVTRGLIFSGTGTVVLTAGQQFESTHCGDWVLLSR